MTVRTCHFSAALETGVNLSLSTIYSMSLKIIYKFLIIIIIIAFNGCAAHKSVISVNKVNLEDIEALEASSIGKIEVDMSAIDKSKKTRFVDQTQALIYDFTFLVHENVHNTLTQVLAEGIASGDLSALSETHEIKVKVEVDSALFIYTGASAAPRYELSISLPSQVFLNQKECGSINVSARDEVVIGAFSNTQEKRDEIMTSRYKEMLTSLYREYLEALTRKSKEC